MPKFKIEIPIKAYLVIKVEAENEGEAMEIAIDEADVSQARFFEKDCIFAKIGQQIVLFDLEADNAEITEIQ